MSIHYKNLWKLLIDEEMNKIKMIKAVGMEPDSLDIKEKWLHIARS